jgi:hypothetical protein
MAKNDRDLFERLRQAGLRKQVAKTLSEIGEGAGKKARQAASSAVSELRSVADELERRMPGVSKATSSVSRSISDPRTRSTAARPRGSRSRASGSSASPRTRRTSTPRTGAATSRAKPTSTPAAKRASTPAAKPATTSRRKPATASPRKPAAASAASSAAATSAGPARAPRGQNKAKILGSLKTGAKTASEIAKETGIGTGTVGSTLSKLATSGEVVKAERGYALPS